MAKYGQAMKDRVLGRLLPPESAAIEAVSREVGISVEALERWRDEATQALADSGEARARPAETRADQQRIKELERELRRKEKALAETAALRVLSKKLSAIFHGAADE